MNLIKSARIRYILLFSLIAMILCFFKLGTNSLGLDEVSTIKISQDWHTLTRMMWYDEGNMWLYYLFVHVWLYMGTSEFVVRSLSALAAVATVPAFYMFAEEATDRKTALVATPLLLANLYFVYYAQDARSYSMALLFVTIASYYLVKIARGTATRLHVALYIIASVLSIYSYLLAALVLGVQYLSLIVVRPIPWKRAVICAALTAISLLPLIAAPAFRGGHQLDWLQKPKLSYLPMGFIILSGDSLILTPIYAGICAALLWMVRRKLFTSREGFNAVWLSIWSVFPIVFGFIFSHLAKPIYEPESFNTVLPGFILLVAMGVVRLFSRRTSLLVAVTAALVLLSGTRLAAWYAGSDNMHLVIENANPRDWKTVVDYIEQRDRSSDAIAFYSYYIRYPVEYYMSRVSTNKPRPHVVEISSCDYALGGGTVLPDFNDPVMDTLSETYPRVWLVLSYNDFDWLGRKRQWKSIEQEFSEYYVLKDEQKFAQVEVKLLEAKPRNTVRKEELEDAEHEQNAAKRCK